MKTLWLLLLISAPLAAQSWVPTFEDDFNGTQLDLSRWTLHDPLPTAPDRHAVAYADTISVSEGQVHIAAPGNSREYAGGIITTYGIFAQLYGRFEVRFRAPAGPGSRAGFALMPIPTGTLPRIDGFTVSGETPDRVNLANHWGSEQTERSYSDSFAVPDLSKGFHTVAVEWERDRITWFVDGKKTFESRDGVPRQRMYLAIDLAARGARADASLDIDYVRVYQHPEQ